MNAAMIHPAWERAPNNMVDGFSLEMTAKDIESLKAAVTFLPGESVEARIEATKLVHSLGFEPMPHFSARRIGSAQEFEDYLTAAVREAGVQRCFVIAGDPSEPEGSFFDSSALIASGAFERAGIKAIGIGGHPEGHPNMTADQCWDVLGAKCAEISARGMAPLIVTQFVFDADAVLSWLAQLRARGIMVPVRVGVPGPAGIRTLLRFAARCGVGASASVLAKYGISLTQLLGSAGPDKLVGNFEERLGAKHGPVRLHFYPFGGLEKTVDWIAKYDRAH